MIVMNDLLFTLDQDLYCVSELEA